MHKYAWQCIQSLLTAYDFLQEDGKHSLTWKEKGQLISGDGDSHFPVFPPLFLCSNRKLGLGAGSTALIFPIVK